MYTYTKLNAEGVFYCINFFVFLIKKEEKKMKLRNKKFIVSIIMAMMMVLAMVPSMAFAEENINPPEQTIYIYQDELEVTDGTIEIPADTSNNDAVKLTAKDAEGNTLTDITWEEKDSSYLSLDSNGAECTVKANVNGIGNYAKISAKLPDGEEKVINVKIIINCVNWEYKQISASNGPKVGEDTGTNLYLLGYTKSGSTLSTFDGDDWVNLLNWYADKMICTKSSNPNLVEASDVKFKVDVVTKRKTRSRLVFYFTPKVAGETVLTFELNTKEFGEWKQEFTVSTIEGIKNLPSAVFMEPSDVEELKPEVEPSSTSNQDVQYSSDNPNVADVVDGKIVAKSSTGHCTITASSKQSDETTYTWNISVNVIKAGFYQYDENDISDITKWIPIKESSVTITKDEPVYIDYFSKDDPLGANDPLEQWQSSNTNVVKTNYREITPVGNGTVKLRMVDSDYNIVPDSEIKLVVNISGFKDAPESVKEDYSPQGENDTTLEVTGKKISTVSSNGFIFENYVNSLEDKKNIEFSFTVSSRKGLGGLDDITDEFVKTNMLDHIKLYDKSDMTKPIAVFDDNKTLEVIESEYNANMAANITFKINPSVLDYNHEYALVFDSDLRLAQTIGRDAVFYFKTKAAIPVKLDKSEKSLIKGERIKLNVLEDTDEADAYTGNVVWKSSDENVAVVDENGNVKAIEKGTAIITVENEDEKSAECKIEVSSPVIGKTDGEEITAIIVDKKNIEITPELKAAGYDTKEKIAEKIYSVAAKETGNKCDNDNTVIWDVKLVVSIDGGKHWTEVTKELFPESGVKVLLDYPNGTNADDYDFTVLHMASGDLNGLKAGEVEIPEVKETKDGLQVTLMSLSPVAINWTKSDVVNSGDNPVIDSQDEPDSDVIKNVDDTVKTGDNMNILIFAVLMVLALATGVAVYRRKIYK